MFLFTKPIPYRRIGPPFSLVCVRHSIQFLKIICSNPIFLRSTCIAAVIRFCAFPRQMFFAHLCVFHVTFISSVHFHWCWETIACSRCCMRLLFCLFSLVCVHAIGTLKVFVLSTFIMISAFIFSVTDGAV